MKVKANFNDGSSLILTIEDESEGIYYFVEKNLCKWWWKEDCELIKEEI